MGESLIELRIYDILEREVGLLVDEEQDAGYSEINFNVSKLSSRIYLYRLQAMDFIESTKQIYMKRIFRILSHFKAPINKSLPDSRLVGRNYLLIIIQLFFYYRKRKSFLCISIH
jgi:hypothetical protein